MFGNKPHTRINDVVRAVIQANHNAACREAAHPCGELIAVFSHHFASTGERFPGITMYTKNSLSATWRLGHIYFSPHGNLFLILRSGDRLEHTQAHTSVHTEIL